MNIDDHSQPAAGSCGRCRDEMPSLEFDFAFQPIVSLKNKCIVAHEALARGPNGEPALSVLDQVTSENQYRFDQDCRTRAIESAAALRMPGSLSINFIPNAVADPRACIRRTLGTAQACGFELHKIVFELTEAEEVKDPALLVKIFQEYRRLGIKTAIDDFGAGYAGLNLLAQFQPDFVKIDIALVRGIDASNIKQTIVEGVVTICHRLGIEVLAEGVETAQERNCLAHMGIDLMQGYLFARPAFRALGAVPDLSFS